MKNITVTVPDEVYRAVGLAAAKRNTSISTLVREYLISISEGESEFARLEAQQHRISSQIARFSASGRVARVDLHDRARP